jgi:hypothetical protein
MTSSEHGVAVGLAGTILLLTAEGKGLVPAAQARPPAGAGGEAKPAAADTQALDGFMAVFGRQLHSQTFTAPAAKIEKLRIRVARTMAVPQHDLFVRLVEPGKYSGKPLARATFYTDWRDWSDKPAGAKGTKVSRFFKWVEADLAVEGLTPGKTYELVFSAPGTGGSAPWLVGCFYRDVYGGGEHRRLADLKPVKLGDFDMVFEITAGEKRAASPPEGCEFPAKNHFGLSHDGVDYRKRTPGGGPL